MVQINIDLPESDSKTVAPSDIIVMLTKDGKMTLNGRKASKSGLKSAIKKEVNKQSNRENATVAIVAEKGVDWQRVNEMMTMAAQLDLKAIIATQPRK